MDRAWRGALGLFLPAGISLDPGHHRFYVISVKDL
jgi:hypothetical protein